MCLHLIFPLPFVSFVQIVPASGCVCDASERSFLFSLFLSLNFDLRTFDFSHHFVVMETKLKLVSFVRYFFTVRFSRFLQRDSSFFLLMHRTRSIVSCFNLHSIRSHTEFELIPFLPLIWALHLNRSGFVKAPVNIRQQPTFISFDRFLFHLSLSLLLFSECIWVFKVDS